MHTITGVETSGSKDSVERSEYIYIISAVAALGGLLFGFDTAVINGAIVFLRAEMALSDAQTEMAASSLLFGCILGASLAGTLSDKFGRKKLLIVSGLLFLLSAIGAAIPTDLLQFSAARFVGGIAIGVASMLSPLYIAEISPAHIRGRLVSLNQLAIVTGILLAFLVNWMLSDFGTDSWRWMFAAAAVPSILFVLSLLFVPESPRWLIGKDRIPAAREILTHLHGARAADQQVAEIRKTLSSEREAKTQIYQRKFRLPLFIAISLAILQQITGINTILYYGSIIFAEYAGSANSSAIGANTIVGAINLICTILALWLIDKLGRKTLLMLASLGMCASLVLLGMAFQMKLSTPLILICVLFYVAFFAVGLGPGVWVLMSEIFPTNIRGRAMSVATIALWSACTLISFTFLSLVNAVGISGTFWLYSFICLLTFILVWRIVPETKGKSLEEIERWWQ
jgi:sugar porter (SP) family MFS transporter